MGFIIKVLITAVAVFVAAYILPGVSVSGLQTTLIVALVLALLNTFLKPILVILTIPITILTLGLFLLIINALLVMFTAYLIDGFTVSGWITAILFSLILSLVSYLLDALVD